MRNDGGGIIEDVGGGPGDLSNDFRKELTSFPLRFRTVVICNMRRLSFEMSCAFCFFFEIPSKPVPFLSSVPNPFPVRFLSLGEDRDFIVPLELLFEFV